jgi:hypothetical protein
MSDERGMMTKQCKRRRGFFPSRRSQKNGRRITTFHRRGELGLLSLAVVL